MGCHFLLQGIFPTQESNPRSPKLQVDSLPTERQGKLVQYSLQGLSWTHPQQPSCWFTQSTGLENSVNCIVHGVTKSRAWVGDFHSLIHLSSSLCDPFWYLLFYAASIKLSSLRALGWAVFQPNAHLDCGMEIPAWVQVCSFHLLQQESMVKDMGLKGKGFNHMSAHSFHDCG